MLTKRLMLQSYGRWDKLNSATTTLVSCDRLRGKRLQDEVVARWADLLVDYCLRVEPGRDDRRQRGDPGAAAGRGLLQGDRPPRRPPAGPARAPGTARVLSRGGVRGPTRSRAPRQALRGTVGERAHPDRGRERHPLDEPGRSPAAGGLRARPRPDPPGRAGELAGS